MPTPTTSIVSKFTLPKGHKRTGKGVKSVFGKATIIVARTAHGDSEPRRRVYTTTGKVRALKSYSEDQFQALMQVGDMLRGEPAPTPEPSVAREARTSLGRGEAAAEASLEAAMTTPKRAKAPKLEDGEHHSTFYARCKALGVSPKSAKKSYRKQVKARK